MTQEREFIDELIHTGEGQYHKLVEAFDGNEVKVFIKALQKLMAEDPFYFDPYLSMVELLECAELKDESADLLEKAYAKAVKLITDEDGKWPDKLQWGFWENRHIIRTLISRGILFWKDDHNDEALSLFGRLLRMNPQDNGGNRHFILAIKMGMSFQGFMDRFDRDGYYDNDISEWFDEHRKKFPAEFEWWDEEIERQGQNALTGHIVIHNTWRSRQRASFL